VQRRIRVGEDVAERARLARKDHEVDDGERGRERCDPGHRQHARDAVEQDDDADRRADAARVEDAEVRAPEVVADRVEVRREGTVRIAHVAVQDVALDEPQRDEHFAPVVDVEIAPSLPRGNEEETEEEDEPHGGPNVASLHASAMNRVRTPGVNGDGARSPTAR